MLTKRQLFNNKNKNNSGFTLVELIVTIAVLAIVLALTTMGILAWQDWSDFNQQNEYAQTLFVAAQNQLTEYSANGRLEEMRVSLAGLESGKTLDDVPDDGRTFVYCPQDKYGKNLTGVISGIVGADGNAYDLDTLFPESDGKDDENKYRDEIVSLRATAGDYSLYLANPKELEETNPEAFWVFELLGAYVYDASILDGGDRGVNSICIEMTPGNGQVFSVLYSNRNNGLIYKTLADSKGSVESDFVADITNRTEKYRRDRMVGYYGVDTLYAATINAMIRPSIASVKLTNKDTFYLTAKLSSKYRAITSRLIYEIDLDSKKDTNAKKLTIVLDGTKLRNESNATTISCPVYRYDENGEKIELGDFPILAWLEKDATIHVVYDAADIQATTYRYENELADIRSDRSENTSFSQTMSFFRFGIDLDNVYATVVAKAAGYTDSKPASNFGNVNVTKNQPGGKNPVFASIEKNTVDSKTNYEYGIVNARHFYNIRYIEDISYEKEAAGYSNVDTVAGAEFSLKEDINFSEFQAEGNLYNSDVSVSPVRLDELNGKIYNLAGEAIENVTRYNCDFPTFKRLRVNDSFDGNGKTISGIRASEISNIFYDIYMMPSAKARAANPVAEVKALGLFNVNNGAIYDLSMDDFAIKGSNMVGAFCGINAGNLDDITTLNTNRNSQVSGVKNVGGIMGFQLMVNPNTTIDNLVNRAGVYGTEAIGGIVGMVRNDFADYDFTGLGLTDEQLSGLSSSTAKTVVINNCDNYGPVYGYTKSKLKGVYTQAESGDGGMPETDPEKIRYVGGIVGYCYNSNTANAEDIIISECVSSLQYTGEELNTILSNPEKLNEKLIGDYVGGIAGYNYYGTIRNCSTEGEKGVEGCIFGYKYVGGIVGLNIGPASGIYGGIVDGAKGINANNVVGCYYAGGITGANANVKDTAVAYDKSIVNSKDPEDLSKKDAILETASSISRDLIIENWTNRGVVIATKEYAGGITGYNSGWIYKCQSEVNYAAVDRYFNTLLEKSDLGDYVGGIAGYNNGIIGNTERNRETGKKSGTSGQMLAADVYVNGHNYVGGIVGYNDHNAIVEDYRVASGYVRGYDNRYDEEKAKSCFVGGYAGLNSSVNLLMDTELEDVESKSRPIYSNPNQINGSYFVGGTIGGNIINTLGFSNGGTSTATPNPEGTVDISVGNTSNGGKLNVKYTITLKNNTNGSYDNWKLGINLPTGFNKSEIVNAQNSNWELDGNTLLVRGKGDNSSIAYDASYKVTLHMKFKNDAEKESFEKALAKAYAEGTINPVINAGDDNQDADKAIYAQYKTDNFLGMLHGDEFVGGFIGYNLIFENENTQDWVVADEGGDRGAVFVVQKKIVDAFGDVNEADGNVLAANKSILDNLNDKLGIELNLSEGSITISGVGNESGKTEFGSIKAKIYVGGVLGYNDDATNTYIRNVENATPIVAEAAIEYIDEQPVIGMDGKQVIENGTGVVRTTNYIDKDYVYTYSYAGGIMGKVSKNTTIDRCWNAHSGSVETHGTYTGGLCEINEGNIINCEVSNFGSGVDDYIGGLCGLNKATGTIERCVFAQKIVSGRNVVGGISAENFGTIKNIKLDTVKINAYGVPSGDKDGVAGLFAGFNGNTGVIELSENLENVQVKSGGRFVGAVAGINEGTVENKKTVIDNPEIVGEKKIDDNLLITGLVEGYYDVGGLIGLNKDSSSDHVVMNYTNMATVTAENGNAGGIIGENASSNKIQYCVNDDVVSATVGNAGGITSVNYGEISYCYGYKSVNAPKGMCGGIASINGKNSYAYNAADSTKAAIRNCYVGPKSVAEGALTEGEKIDKIQFISTQSVGGVSAWNFGIIEDNTMDNVVVTNIGTVLNTSIGVVIGDNKTTGKIYLKGNQIDVNECEAIAKTNNCNIGGVAGTNAGLIANKASYAANSSATHGFALVSAKVYLDGATYGSIGGVTGNNTGTIAYCQVDASIEGKLGTDTTGYGGIAGYSGYATKEAFNAAKESKHKNEPDYRALIIGCTFDGEIMAPGSAGDPANVGGITGVNGYGGLIKKCSLGVRENDFAGNEELQTSITSGDITKTVKDPDLTAYAYIGGIAGRNYADIYEIDMNGSSSEEFKSVDNKISIISYAGAAGGMVGMQYAEANLSGEKISETKINWISTPESMYVEMRRGENDSGAGGVIGYSKSGNPLSYIRNYAEVVNDVELNVKAGGVVGSIQQQDVICVDLNCLENYGYVHGYKQVGGIIGRSKFCAVNMTDCDNYGEVWSTNGSCAGIIARVYDVRNTEVYFTRCDNYGYVHDGGTNGNYIGGLIAFLDSSTNIVCYLYDCDNVGIVKRDKEEYVTAQTNGGSFVGNGTSGTWYFEQCQNYNTASNINGFVGNAGTVHLKDCLDNSNLTTNGNLFSPFLGSGVTSQKNSTGLSATTSSFENCYYLSDKNDENNFVKDAGAYFTLVRSTAFDNYFYLGQKYQDLKNPALYLTAPSANILSRIPKNSVVEFNVEYDKTKCSGIKDFSIYYWNGSAAAPATAVPACTAEVTFRDTDKNVQTVSKAFNTVHKNSVMDDKVTLEVPAGMNDVEFISVKFAAGNDVYLRGFSYTPEGSGAQAECTYLSKKNDTSFSLSSISTNGVLKTKTDGMYGHSITGDFFDDILALDFTDNNCFLMKSANNTSSIEYDFDVYRGDSATDMSAFVFVPSADNTGVRYIYDYEVTFTDSDGAVGKVYGNKANNTEAKGLSDVYSLNDGIVVDVPDSLNGEITHITLSMSNSKKITSNTDGSDKFNASNCYYLHGFGWIPEGSTRIERMAGGKLNNRKLENYISTTFFEKLIATTTDADVAPHIYAQHNPDVGFDMESNNPVTAAYYADKDDWKTSLEKPDGSDSRLRVYREVHPKFVEMIRQVYSIEEKLATPKLSLDVSGENASGKYTVKWNAIPNAYEYEFKYTVTNSAGEVVEESPVTTLGGSVDKYAVMSKPGWEGNEIAFSVKAVNALRYTKNDDSYDSDWGSIGVYAKKTLVQPVTHIEVTADNKMVAVLDNREDYKIADSDEYENCIVEVKYDTYVFTIPVSEGFISENAIFIDNFAIGSDYNMLAQAKPVPDDPESLDRYMNSTTYYLRGHLVDNNLLNTMYQYTTTSFYGFFGDEADNMIYNVYYDANSRDCFIKADIIAFDETIGAEVSYSNMLTHVAATSGSAKFTATLSDIPQEWFADDFKNPIIAREYLHASQYDVVHYERVIANDVVLDGEDANENMAILAQITNPYHITTTTDADGISSVNVEEDVSIVDGNSLKAGYTLERKQDGKGEYVYDVVYNSTIELAVNAAAQQNALLTGDAKYQYYMNCVDYKIYTAQKSTVDVKDAGINKLSVQKIVSDVNLDDYQESFMTRNNYEYSILNEELPIPLSGTYYKADGKAKVNNYAKVQEIQPAPVIDEVYTEDTVNGHSAYTFTFDEFCKDVYCMTVGGTSAAGTWYSQNTEAYMTKADEDITPTWYIFAQKSGYYDTNDLTVKQRIMNAYYYTYCKAQYRVDFIGTTIDGEEATIESKTVTAPVLAKKIVDDNGKDLYDIYNYEVTFSDDNDVWKDYSDYTVRVMRLGTKTNMAHENISGTKNIPGISRILDTNGRTFVLPRYSDYKIHVLHKFNTIDNPSVELHKEGNAFVMDNLLYDVTYGAITNENQLKDLGGYLITAKVVNAADPSNVTSTHYYYVKDYDEDVAGNDIALDIDELAADGSIVTEIDKDNEYTKNNNARIAVIDLSDFNSGDEIMVTVRAIAGISAENYIDGIDGNGKIVRISDRLPVPDISKLVIDESIGMSKEESDDVNGDEYSLGYYVNYTSDEQYAKYQNVSVKMAIAVFDEKTEENSQKANSGDGFVNSWNDGAIATMYAKKTPLDMGYVPTKTPVRINLSEIEDYPGQYAGKWLKIAAKATSASRIASKWTDEDAADETDNYLWIHIPDLQLDDVEATETTDDDVVGGNDVSQMAIELTEDKCVDVYRFTVVGDKLIKETDDAPVDSEAADSEAEDPPVEKMTLPVYMIEIRRRGNDEDNSRYMDVYVKDASLITMSDKPDETTSKDGEWDKAGSFDVSSSDNQSIDNLNIMQGEYYNPDVKTCAKLRYIASSDINGNGTYKLVLPDVVSIGNSDYGQYDNGFVTSQVLVEAHTDTANEQYVAPENAAMWLRTESEAVWSTMIISKDALTVEGNLDWIIRK